MNNRILSLAAAAATLLLAFAPLREARAQAHVTAGGPGTYLSAGGGVSIFQSDYGKRTIGGGFAVVDMHPTWRYGLEAEGRWLRYNTDQSVTQTNYFIGPHVNIKEFGRFVPYGKLLVGAGQMTFPFGFGNGTFFAIAPGGGVDIRLGERFTVRAPDFEYQVWTDAGPLGSIRPYGVSVGITYRINGIDRYPGKNRRPRH